MTLIYHSIVAAIRLGRSTEEIIEELNSQSGDDPGYMVKILIRDLTAMIRKHEIGVEELA